MHHHPPQHPVVFAYACSGSRVTRADCRPQACCPAAECAASVGLPTPCPRPRGRSCQYSRPPHARTGCPSGPALAAPSYPSVLAKRLLIRPFGCSAGGALLDAAGRPRPRS
eukprot:10594_4